jgi:uncharacterized protein
MTKSGETLLEFPCDFPIKAVARSEGNPAELVAEIVGRHVPSLSPDAVSSRPSREGRFTSVTVTVRAESKAQLDAIYRELSGHSGIIMVL